MGAQGSRLLKGLRPTQTREYCCKTLPADLAPRKLGALAGVPKGTCRSNAKDFRGRKKPTNQSTNSMVETFQFVERKGDASRAPTAAAPGAAGALGPPAPGAAAVGTPAAPEEDDVPF